MAEHAAVLAERWIRGPVAGAGIPVLCLPHAGGGAAAYTTWRQTDDDRVRFLPVRLPGREDRISEPAARDARVLARDLADVVGEIGAPVFAVFGHSMGALLAFELTRELRRRGGRLPEHLFVAGSQAPDRLPALRLHELPQDRLVAALSDLGGTSRAALQTPQLMSLVEPTLRADFELCELYVYSEEPPLDVPITAIGGLRDPRVPPSELAAWRTHTSAEFDVLMLDAGHFFLESARTELVDAIAERVA